MTDKQIPRNPPELKWRPDEGAPARLEVPPSRRRLSLAWIVALIVSGLVASLGVGAAAYRSSLRAVNHVVAHENLMLAVTLDRMAQSWSAPEQGSALDLGQARDRLLECWQYVEPPYPQMFVCLVDPAGKIIRHSSSPSNVGRDVGHVLLDPQSGYRLADLLRQRGRWSGENTNASGVRQLVGYYYSPDLDAAVAVHVPSAVIARSFHASAEPWIAAFALVSGVLIPLLFCILVWRVAAMKQKLNRYVERLEASESRLRTMLDASPECIKLLDAQCNLIEINDAGMKMVEADSFESIKGSRVHRVIHPKYRRAFRDLNRRVFQGQTGKLRYEVVGLRGTHRWLDTDVAPVFDSSGRVIAQLAITRDISEQVAAEQALRESEQKFRELTEHAPAYIGIVQNGTLVYANLGFRECAGFREEDMPLDSPFQNIAPETQRGIMEKVMVCLEEGTPDRTEFEMLCADGTNRWVDLAIRRIHLGGAPAILVIGIDVSDRHAALQELEAKKEELRRLNESLEQIVAERTRQLRDSNAELEAFAHTVSHDLRAPLRAMEGFALALLEDFGDQLGEEGREFAQHIITSAHRMDTLVNDLLAYSRLGKTSVHMTDIELEETVRAALDELAPEIDRTGATIHLPPSFPVVRSHRRILRQIVINLISNALKFVAPGTRPEITVSVEESPEVTRITVADNGIGISPEYHNSIFRVFERLHGVETYPGTGIGLAIVARGCARLGARYGVRSEPGKGSAFWIEIPKAHTHADSPRLHHTHR